MTTQTQKQVFLSSPALPRNFTTDSLIAVYDHQGSTRVLFTDGSVHTLWQRSTTEFAAMLAQYLPGPMLKITTPGAVKRNAYINLGVITGWSALSGALGLHTSGATVLMPGYDLMMMNEAIAAAGHTVVVLGK